MVALAALGVGTAFAQTTTTGPVCTFAPGNKATAGKTTCVTTTTTKETTNETTNLPNEFVVTNLPDETVVTPLPTEFVVTNLPNEFVRTPTSGPCTVGNSGRVGTAEGISTQELAVTSTQALAVTSTQVFKVTSTQAFKVTSTQTFEVTTVTVKTEIFTGNTTKQPNPKDPESSVISPPVVTKTPTGAPVVTKTPTGDPVIDKTPIGAPVVTKTPTGDPVVTKTPTGDPVFTATGKCKNVSGPQERGNQPVDVPQLDQPVATLPEGVEL
jgi:hypothetical protein